MSFSFYIDTRKVGIIDLNGNVQPFPIGGSSSDITAPNNVTNLVVSNLGTTTLTLSWSASTSSDIQSYDIYNGSTFITNTASTTYNVTGLTANASYVFWVKAKDNVGNIALGTSLSITTNQVDTTAPTVTIAPTQGTYSSTQSVTLSANETATIYYTTNGTTPTTSSSVYSTPISVSTTTTIKYFAKDTAGNSSTVQTADYTITAGDTTAPTITASPLGATFGSSQNVTLSSNETSDIYYTISGSNPSLNGIGLPKIDKVVVVILENHALSQIQGNTSQAPYINSLMSQGCNLQNYKAITHPSQPNYFHLFAGSNMGVTDSTYTPPQFNTPNLYTVLNSGNYTFAGYSQSQPSNGYTGIDDSYFPYGDRHNPWKSFTNVPSSSNLTFASFPSSNFSLLPTVSYVVPDDLNNMHDGTIQACDTWLQTNIDPYLQWAKNNNSLLIVVFDEDDDTGGNNTVPCIFIGAMVKTGTNNTSYTHHSLLRTLSDLYGVGYAGASSTASPITDVWKTPLTNYAPASGSYLYQKPITIATTTTLKYLGRDTAGNNSTIQTQTYTITDITPPNNVTNLTTSNVQGTTLTLNWTASTSGDIASYDIYNGATFITNVSTTTYNVTGLTSNTAYTFWVKAKDTAGNVASGTSVGVTTSTLSNLVSFSDSFNRTATTTSLGTSDSYAGGTNQSWSQLGDGGYGIDANGYAYMVTSPTSKNIAYFDTGYADGTISANLRGFNTEYPKLAFRIVDELNLIAVEYQWTEGRLQLRKYIAGTSTILANSSTFTPNINDVVKVTASGSNITVYLNGVSVITFTETYNQTATKWGFSCYYANSRVNDWKVETLPALFSDSFNRTANATSLGSTDSAYGGTTKTWTIMPATGGTVYGINASGQAYPSTPSPTRTIEVFDTGVANGTVSLKLSSIGTNERPKLVFRVVDQDNMLLLGADGTGQLELYAYQTGSNVGYWTGGTAINGDTISVTFNNSTVQVYRNGTLLTTQTITYNQTATKVGFNIYNYPTSSVDDFKFN